MDKEKTKNVIAIAIRPIFANAILSGKKTVEFRKNGVPKNIETIVLYSTLPDQKIVGYCHVDECIVDHPESLWKKYGDRGFINYSDFCQYYKKTETGKCYIIGKVYSFKKPVFLDKCKSFSKAPQSFAYMNKIEWKNFKRKKTK